jgi:hypothetical protein
VNVLGRSEVPATHPPRLLHSHDRMETCPDATQATLKRLCAFRLRPAQKSSCCGPRGANDAYRCLALLLPVHNEEQEKCNDAVDYRE